MPLTLAYRPVLVDTLISNARISSYQGVFNAKSDHELVGAYLWNSHVCSAIYPLVGAAEIALRNAIDSALTAQMGRFWWKGTKLQYKSFAPGAPVPHSVTAVRENFSKATKKYISEKTKRYPTTGPTSPHHDGVIAKTEFSTWEFLLDSEFMWSNGIWPKYLGKVFSGTWPSSSASTTLLKAHDLVATVREFRNRLFHHEPAWKRYGIASEHGAIHHLHEKLQRIEALLSLIHPEKLKLLQRNGLLAAAYRACSIAELRRFQHAAPEHRIASTRKLAAMALQAQNQNVVIKAKTYKRGACRFLITPIR